MFAMSVGRRARVAALVLVVAVLAGARAFVTVVFGRASREGCARPDVLVQGVERSVQTRREDHVPC